MLGLPSLIFSISGGGFIIVTPFVEEEHAYSSSLPQIWLVWGIEYVSV